MFSVWAYKRIRQLIRNNPDEWMIPAMIVGFLPVVLAFTWQIVAAFLACDLVVLTCWLIAFHGARLFAYLIVLPFRAMNKWQRERASRDEANRRAIEFDRRKQLDSLRTSQTQRENERRNEARSRCELLYAIHEADIRDRFSRSAMDAYMLKYMGDAESPDVVERRGVELQAVIEKHCEAVGISEKPRSIDQLAKWFLEEKDRIEGLPLDDRMRATHVAHLNMRYAELSQEILESIRP